MVAIRDAFRKRKLRLHPKVVTVNALKVFWVLVVLWCELGAFFWSVAWCRWPKRVGDTSLRVLLVADPQVPRPHKGWVPRLTWLKQHVVNHNLRKSWIAAKTLRPNVTVFLGDMLRHGSMIKTMDEYGEYFARFQSIFRMDSAVSTYYVPGNHDVGLGSSSKFSLHARGIFKSHFGPINQRVTVANHTFILLDAPALVEEDYRRHGAQEKFADWLGMSGGSIDFVKSVATSSDELPVVLFTHIPLARPDSASCGPLREHGNIRRGVGRGYQSLLGRETSKFLLETIRPTVIFSADDHDYCEYVHTASNTTNTTLPSVREVTVKSISMATRLDRPGFHLLSLFPPTNSTSTQPPYADVLCLLPSQSRIYKHGYAPLLLLSLLLISLLNLRRTRPPHINGELAWDHNTLAPRDPSPSGTSPTAPSPPASPIHYKSSHSHAPAPALRSASTLTPGFPSLPPTPLGGTPLLSPLFPRAHVEDEEGQELLVWSAQPAPPAPSPYLASPRDMGGVDSAYFLPSPGAQPRAGTTTKSVWLPTLRPPRTRLTMRPSYISALTKPVLVVGRVVRFVGVGGGVQRRAARTFRARVVLDVVHVAALPTLVYVVISVWLLR